MKTKIITILLLAIFLTPSTTLAENDLEKIVLPVPYTSEIPTGSWTKPWNNACEEASIIMVDSFYSGDTEISKTTAINKMTPLFKIENKIFGSNADTDATRTAKLANEYLNFTATIKNKPTIEEIKNQLRNNHPVITLHYAKNLKNPNHRWRVGGSYYHMMVLIGFDDNTEEFITNDSGDSKTGGGYRYSYLDIMKSLHDFNHQTHRADGPARVLFTSSKVLFREQKTGRTYLINHDTKHYITAPSVFKKFGWKWNKVRKVDQATLDKFKDGDIILP